MNNKNYQFGGELTSDGAHFFPVRIYYEDTDFSGNVYHAAYVKFFERARTEFLRATGVHHHELLKEHDVAFAVRSLNIEYYRSAHIDDLLEITTRIDQAKGSRLELVQKMHRDGELITEARVIAVAIKSNGRPTRLPQSIMNIIRL